MRGFTKWSKMKSYLEKNVLQSRKMNDFHLFSQAVALLQWLLCPLIQNCVSHAFWGDSTWSICISNAKLFLSWKTFSGIIMHSTEWKEKWWIQLQCEGLAAVWVFSDGMFSRSCINRLTPKVRGSSNRQEVSESLFSASQSAFFFLHFISAY